VTKLYMIEGPPGTISQYLPGNYQLTHYRNTRNHRNEETTFCYIEGEDVAGWTLEGYVKPRLESGLWFGLTEIDSIDPEAVMYDEI